MTEIKRGYDSTINKKYPSQEHLTVEHSRSESQGTDGGTKLEIYRTYDVTQTSDAGSANAQDRV
jgi:hypothetical protein